MASKFTNGNVDRLGAVCSGACTVHCATAGFFPHLAAAVGLGAALGPYSEWLLTSVAIVLAGFALRSHWRRFGMSMICGLFAAGILGLLLGRLLEELEVHGLGSVVSIAAGLTLAWAHIWGLRAARRSARTV